MLNNNSLGARTALNTLCVLYHLIPTVQSKHYPHFTDGKLSPWRLGNLPDIIQLCVQIPPCPCLTVWLQSLCACTIYSPPSGDTGAWGRGEARGTQGSNREYRKELAVERGIKYQACMGGKQKSGVLDREKEKDDVKRGR